MEESAVNTPTPVKDGANPCGLQVLKLKDDSYEIDMVALERILLQENIKDLPVVVISIAGAYRGGKSFMLNFFLRYLNSPELARNEAGEWLGDDNKPLTGFSWRGGSTRHTTGIVMWSNPIECTLPSGEKVAVILMDTQGTFDNSSTMRDSSTIFALSTLLASVQIYNVSSKIKEDDLQHLQFFTEYGRLANTKDGKKSVQMLEFLVRDWQFPYEYPYGIAGGEKVVEKSLEITEDLPKEMQELRQNIRSCFENVTGFLMPHPGFSVYKPTFDGRLSDIEPDFKTLLLELVPSILAPEKLMPKVINGEKVKARELLTYFKTYVDVLNSKEMPTPVSIMKATSDAAILSGIEQAKALYESTMELKCGRKQPSWPRSALVEAHESAVNEARTSFINKKKMGSPQDLEAHIAQLIQDLDNRLPDYLFINEGKLQKAISEGKEKYEAYILAVHGKESLCLHPSDVEKVHNEAVLEATTVFDSQRKQFLNVKDEERNKFLENLAKNLTDLQSKNDTNNKFVLAEIRKEYSSTMQNICAKFPPVSEDDFDKEHHKALTVALDTFETKRNRSKSNVEDVYRTELIENLMMAYTQMSKINIMKNKEQQKQALNFYENQMYLFWHSQFYCLHPQDLRSAHESAKSQALKMYHPENDADDEDLQKLMLARAMDMKYSNSKNLNDSMNEEAVRIAYNKYRSGMSNDCSPTGWWILIVPMIVNRNRKSKYHQQNKDAALRTFYNRRRSANTRAYDYYLQDLIWRIDSAYDDF